MVAVCWALMCSTKTCWVSEILRLVKAFLGAQHHVPKAYVFLSLRCTIKRLKRVYLHNGLLSKPMSGRSGLKGCLAGDEFISIIVDRGL